MRFIVDAQLPKSLSVWLKSQGLDAIHTLELPDGNASDDLDIIRFADQNNLIVVSKDSDFRDDHILKGSPQKLLIIKTGNIINRDLLRLFELNIDKIVELFEKYDLIELNWHNIIVHK